MKQCSGSAQIHCRDNVTLFSGHKVVGYGIALLLYALRLLHLYTETLTFFELFLILEGLLSRCRCRDALKLSRAQRWNFPLKATMSLRFTEEQLMELKTSNLAALVCRNMDQPGMSTR